MINTGSFVAYSYL